MKISRSGLTERKWHDVTQKAIGPDAWQKSRLLRIEITIDKSGTRRSEALMEITRDDAINMARGLARGDPDGAIELLRAMVCEWPAAIKDRDAKMEQLSGETVNLRDGFRQIEILLNDLRWSLPSEAREKRVVKRALSAIERLCTHYKFESRLAKRPRWYQGHWPGE